MDLKFILFLISIFNFTSLKAMESFLVHENGTPLLQEGDITTRHSPCSTFKIPLALMAFDAGIFQDESLPVFEIGEKERVTNDFFLEMWEGKQTPHTFTQRSIVPISQKITHTLGQARFQAYVDSFAYGNHDISGTVGENNALMSSWISSSLKIAPQEQMIFLEKLLRGTLPVSEHAHQMTKKILYVETFENGWTLYGKTGSGYLLDEKGTKTPKFQRGWFIGWLEKENRQIPFVYYQESEVPSGGSGGRIAKDTAIARLKIMSNAGL